MNDRQCKDTWKMRRGLIVLVMVMGCAPKRIPMTPVVRTETVSTEAEVEGLTIGASPFGAAGWTIRVSNGLETPVSIVWDESSFVASSGTSGGRLIRGETRNIDSAKTQPATPVAPGATAVEHAFAEHVLEIEKYEADVARINAMQYGLSEDEHARVLMYRQRREGLINGGSINLVVRVGGETKMWRGRVSGTGSSAASAVVEMPFYCASTGQCLSDRAACGTECLGKTSAWCAKGNNGFVCGVDRQTCLILRDKSRDRGFGECVTRKTAIPN